MPIDTRSRDWEAIQQDDDAAATPDIPVKSSVDGEPANNLRAMPPEKSSQCSSRRHVVIAVSLIILVTAAVAAFLKLRSLVKAPVQRFELEVGFSLFRLAGYDVALMAYNGRTLGPTLTVRPGGTLALKLLNRLPPNKRFAPSAPNVSAQWPCWRTSSPGAPVPEPASAPLAGHEQHDPAIYGNHLPSEEAHTPFDYVNSPHAFRTTNLHAHGLQVPPREDDPFLRLEPGSAADLTLHLPPDHPSGVFWYHPHGHGGVTVQSFNGLAGAIEIPGDLEASVTALPSVRQPPLLLPVQEVALVELDNASRADIAALLGLASEASLPVRLHGNDPAAFACAGATRGGGFQYMSGFDLRVRVAV